MSRVFGKFNKILVFNGNYEDCEKFIYHIKELKNMLRNDKENKTLRRTISFVTRHGSFISWLDDLEIID